MQPILFLVVFLLNGWSVISAREEPNVNPLSPFLSKFLCNREKGITLNKSYFHFKGNALRSLSCNVLDNDAANDVICTVFCRVTKGSTAEGHCSSNRVCVCKLAT